MSYNHSKLRSLAIPQQIQPSANLEPASSRTQLISLYPSQANPYGPLSTEISDIDDGVISDTVRKFREVSYKRDEVPVNGGYTGKENINSDADDLFDNFDRCYRARFSGNKNEINENNPLPVRRDLLNELLMDSSRFNSCLSGVKTPLAFANKSYFQRPKEFQAVKASKYFDMKTPSNMHPMNRPQTNFDVKNEEDVENEDQEHRQINVRNIIVTQNSNSINSTNEQKTLNKMKNRRTNEDVNYNRSVLNDVTNNNTDRQSYKGSVYESERSNRLSTVEMLSRRQTLGTEVLGDQRRLSLIQNTSNDTKKLHFGGMLGSFHKERNMYPPSRNSYNGRGSETQRNFKQDKVIERPKSVTRGIQDKAQNGLKVAPERRSAKIENENKSLRGSVKVYNSLLQYFEKAKRELKNGSAVRSTSEHRR